MICDDECVEQTDTFKNQSRSDVLAWPDGQRESYCRKLCYLKRQNRCCRGFTLIELLVVISIIALLVSILMPGLRKARQTAQRVACSNNMRQIVFGLYYYAQDNDDVFPPTGPGVYTSYWDVCLDRYLGGTSTAVDTLEVDADIWDCPSNRSPRSVYSSTGKRQGSWLSYVSNRWMVPDKPFEPRYKWSKITNPTEKFIVFERSFKYYFHPATMVGGWNFAEIGGLSDDTGQLTPENTPHILTTNIAFVDTHVEPMPNYYPGFHLYHHPVPDGDAYIERHWVPGY